MTVVLEPTVGDLKAERSRLLTTSPFDESELRERSARYSLSPEESRVLRRLGEIRFLLGEAE